MYKSAKDIFVLRSIGLKIKDEQSTQISIDLTPDIRMKMALFAIF